MTNTTRRTYHVFSCSTVLLLVCSIAPAKAATIDAEVGRDVGDGQAPYNTPYDPKNVKDMTFVAPTPEYPYYEIVIPLGDLNEGKQTGVYTVKANGVDDGAFYSFVDGYSRSDNQYITKSGSLAKNVVVVTRSIWHDDEPTTVEIDLGAIGADGKVKRHIVTKQAKAPSQGGVPAGWRRYQSLMLQEKNGLDRVNEPVEFSITERTENVGDLTKELRVFLVNPERKTLEPVPFQTFNAQQYAGSPPGTTQPWNTYPGQYPNYLTHPVKTTEGVIMANVPAKQSRVYVFVYDNPSVSAPEPPASDLVVTGKSLGAKVENKFYTAKLFESSGCISQLQLKPDGDRTCPILTNALTLALHYNPDSFGDNGAWGHVFAWDPPDRVVVSARGPLLYRVTLSGRMPAYTPQIHASVSYSFYAGVPYIRVTTVTQVRDPFIANAIRNGELVLDSHLVDHFVWEEKNGDVRRIRTLHGPNYQDEWCERVDHDVHWIAMTNELDGYGIGSAIVESLAFNPEQGEATAHRPAFYLYYHHRWHTPLTYYTRGWVYPFTDLQKGPDLPVSPGSTYVERLGIVPFYLHEGDDRYKDIARAGAQLRNPLSQRWGR